MKQIFVLLALAISMSAQTAKPARKIQPKTIAVASAPQIGDAFSKIALKLLFATQSESYKSKELSDELQAEMDMTVRPNEAMVYADLANYSLFHDLIKSKVEILRLDLQSKCWTEGIDGNKPGFGCNNPYVVDIALMKTDNYRALTAQEGQCVGKLEGSFRRKAPIPLPAECHSD